MLTRTYLKKRHHLEALGVHVVLTEQNGVDSVYLARDRYELRLCEHGLELSVAINMLGIS
jgi:hypothetical protein